MSRDLALQVARERGAYLPIVMSTIQAESNFRNVIGAYGRPSARWGAGYGQVHPAWHADDVRDVARRLRVALPAAFAGVPWQSGNQVWDRFERREPVAVAVREVIDSIILRNNLFSMHLSVQVIQKIWEASGRDFDRFVRAYVGPAIPPADIGRRRKLLTQWRQTLGERPAAPPQAAATPVLALHQDAAGWRVSGSGLAAGTDIEQVMLFLAALGVGGLIAWHRGQLKEEDF